MLVNTWPKWPGTEYLAVPVTSGSPERLFSSVGLVKCDLWGNLLNATLIDVKWAKEAPYYLNST